MAQRTLNVLFVCEQNSIRSIMAEALLNRFGEGRFRAFGADLEPAAKVHPLTLELMQSSGLPTAHLRPQSFREFMTPGAAKMDFVILMGAKTMTAAVRGLPGHPMLAQWGISDPVISGDVVAQRFAFRRAFRELENRIRLFVLVQQKRQPERAFEEPQQAQNA
jgi:arsenate reductase (thioredoxin)